MASQSSEQIEQQKNLIIQQLKNDSQIQEYKIVESFDHSIDLVHIKHHSGEQFTLKFPSNYDDHFLEDINLLKNCNHRNVIKIVNPKFKLGDKEYVAIEKVSYTLQDYVQNKGKDLTKQLFYQLAEGLIMGIGHIHKKNYVLKDLSSNNFFVDEQGNIKVSSICAPRLVNKEQTTKKFLQFNEKMKSIFYPPELLQLDNNSSNDQKMLEKSGDVWSFAMALYFLLGATDNDILEITKGNSEFEYKNNIDENINTLFIITFDQDPENRPDLEGFLENLKEICPQEMEEEIDVSPNKNNNVQNSQNTQVQSSQNSQVQNTQKSYPQQNPTSYQNNSGFTNPLSSNPFSMFNQLEQKQVNGETSSKGFNHIKPKQKQEEYVPQLSSNQLNTEPQNCESAIDHGLYYFHQRDFNKSIEKFKQAIKFNPQSQKAFTKLGEAYQNAEKLNDALAYFKQLSEDNSKNDLPLVEMGRIYYNQANYEKAIEQFNKASELNADNFSYYSLFGSAYNKVNKNDFAIFYSRQAQKYDKDDWFATYNIGWAYVQKKRLDISIQFLKEALGQNKHSDIFVGLGLAYKGKGEIDEAISQFEEAKAINPMSDDAYLYLGQIYEEIDTDSALYNYEEALKINPLNKAAETGAQKLKAK